MPSRLSEEDALPELEFFEQLNFANPEVALKSYSVISSQYPSIRNVAATEHDDHTIVFVVFREVLLEEERYHTSTKIFAVHEDSEQQNDVYEGPSLPIADCLTMSINTDCQLVITLRGDSNKHVMAVLNYAGYSVRSIDITKSIDGMRVVIPYENEYRSLIWSPLNDKVLLAASRDLRVQTTRNRGSYGEILADLFHEDSEWAGEDDRNVGFFVLVVVNLHPFYTSMVELPYDVWPSDLNWADNETIYLLGVKLPGPLKLGRNDFSNRPSSIYRARLKTRRTNEMDKDIYEISLFMDGAQHGLSLHSPRVSPDGEYMAYTAHEAYGPQRQCREICLCKLKARANDPTRNRTICHNTR